MKMIAANLKEEHPLFKEIIETVDDLIEKKLHNQKDLAVWLCEKAGDISMSSNIIIAKHATLAISLYAVYGAYHADPGYASNYVVLTGAQEESGGNKLFISAMATLSGDSRDIKKLYSYCEMVMVHYECARTQPDYIDRVGIQWKFCRKSVMSFKEADKWVKSLGNSWRMPTSEDIDGAFIKEGRYNVMPSELKTRGGFFWTTDIRDDRCVTGTAYAIREK